MKHESVAERYAERGERNELAKEYSEKLCPALKEIADDLSSEGFRLDDECRIRPEEFEERFGAAQIAGDQTRVAGLEQKFAASGDARDHAIGELWEMTKTALVNRELFGGGLIAVRTSKYDDYENGIDELIYDRTSREVIAAVDETTNLLGSPEKMQKFLTRIKFGGRVKYGYQMTPGGVIPTSFAELPVFAITAEPERVLGLAKRLLENAVGDERAEIAKRILEQLRFQAQEFAQSAVIKNPRVRDAYRRIGRILDQLAR